MDGIHHAYKKRGPYRSGKPSRQFMQESLGSKGFTPAQLVSFEPLFNNVPHLQRMHRTKMILELMDKHGFGVAHINTLLLSGGGLRSLTQTYENIDSLKTHCGTIEKILSIASDADGHNNIDVICSDARSMIINLEFTMDHIMKLLSKTGGAYRLNTLLMYAVRLLNSGFQHDTIVNAINNVSRSMDLEPYLKALLRHGPAGLSNVQPPVALPSASPHAACSTSSTSVTMTSGSSSAKIRRIEVPPQKVEEIVLPEPPQKVEEIVLPELPELELELEQAEPLVLPAPLDTTGPLNMSLTQYVNFTSGSMVNAHNFDNLTEFDELLLSDERGLLSNLYPSLN